MEGDRKPRARSGQSRKIPMHRGRGDGADRPTLHSIEGWKKNQQPKPLRCHVGPRMQSECRECMSVSVCAPKQNAALCILGSVRRRVSRGAVTAPRATRRDSSALFFSHSLEANLCRSLELFQASASTHPSCPPKSPNPLHPSLPSSNPSPHRLPCESPTCLVSGCLGCP